MICNRISLLGLGSFQNLSRENPGNIHVSRKKTLQHMILLKHTQTPDGSDIRLRPALLKGTSCFCLQSNRHIVAWLHPAALDVLDSELWRTWGRFIRKLLLTLAQSRHPQTGTGSVCCAQKSPCQVSGVKIFIGNPAFKHHFTFLLIQSYSNSSNRPIVS